MTHASTTWVLGVYLSPEATLALRLTTGCICVAHEGCAQTQGHGFTFSVTALSAMELCQKSS